MSQLMQLAATDVATTSSALRRNLAKIFSVPSNETHRIVNNIAHLNLEQVQQHVVIVEKEVMVMVEVIPEG